MKDKESPEGKMCSLKPEEKDGERGEGGEEMEGSISNFSPEFTVDGFPIRLGENSKV